MLNKAERELARLRRLRDKGDLTEREFYREKNRLLEPDMDGSARPSRSDWLWAPWSGVGIAAFLVWRIVWGGEEDSTGPPVPTLWSQAPDDQQAFVALVSAEQEVTSNLTELQARDVAMESARLKRTRVCELFRAQLGDEIDPARFSNWLGKVSSVGNGRKATLDIQIGPETVITTSSVQGFSQGDPLYPLVSTLREGQTVSISGAFKRDADQCITDLSRKPRVRLEGIATEEMALAGIGLDDEPTDTLSDPRTAKLDAEQRCVSELKDSMMSILDAESTVTQDGVDVRVVNEVTLIPFIYCYTAACTVRGREVSITRPLRGRPMNSLDICKY